MGVIMVGRTECRACGRILTEADEYRYVRGYAGVHRIAGFREGAYHSSCLAGATFRDAYEALEQQMHRHRLCSQRDVTATGQRWGEHLWEVQCSGCHQTLWQSAPPLELGEDDTDPGV
jgi:hypothetical protein